MNGAGHSEELIAIIEDPTEQSQIPLSHDNLEFVLVDAFEAAGKTQIADIHWKKIVRNTRSGNRKGKLLRMAQWADRRDYPERAIDAYQTLIEEFPSYTPQWYDRISSLTRRTGQLLRLSAITGELREKHPENIVYQHNHAYLSIVAGEDLDQAADLLGSLVRDSPGADAARCCLAVIEKIRGDDQAMVAQLEEISPERLDPIALYIYGVLSGEQPTAPASITRAELDLVDRLRS